jgi:hypothetical protein
MSAPQQRFAATGEDLTSGGLDLDDTDQRSNAAPFVRVHICLRAASSPAIKVLRD